MRIFVVLLLVSGCAGPGMVSASTVPASLQVCPDKIHYLDTAEGYVKGYSVFGARPEWHGQGEREARRRKFVHGSLLPAERRYALVRRGRNASAARNGQLGDEGGARLR